MVLRESNGRPRACLRFRKPSVVFAEPLLQEAEIPSGQNCFDCSRPPRSSIVPTEGSNL